MEVIVNGKKQELPDRVSLKAYLESKGINPNVVACELNLKIIKRAELGNVELNPGDELEILQMMGGG